MLEVRINEKDAVEGDACLVLVVEETDGGVKLSSTQKGDYNLYILEGMMKGIIEAQRSILEVTKERYGHEGIAYIHGAVMEELMSDE